MPLIPHRQPHPALSALTLMLWFIAAPALTAPCDPVLLQQAKAHNIAAQIAYGPRRADERCEGFYGRRVNSGGGLEVVGLMQRPLRFGPDDKRLAVRAVVQDRAVLVRGWVLPPDRYYRLDAELAPNATLDWPLKLLTDRGYRPNQVTLCGYLADDPDWLTPIDVEGTESAAASPRLLLRAATDLADVSWRSATMVGGECPPLQDDWRTLGGYAAYKPIVIPLDAAAPGERICIDVQATDTEGELLDSDGPLRILRR